MEMIVDYKKHYELLIEKAKGLPRKKGNGHYYENHHIQPKLFGGTNDPSNLILLTAKEHFVAHHLLAKAFGDKHSKFWTAYWMMCNMKNKNRNRNRKYHITSRSYETARIKHAKMMSEANTGKRLSDATRKKISEAKQNMSDSTRKKLSEAKKGKSLSDSTRKKLSEAQKGENNPMYGKTHSSATRKKMSEAKQNMSDATRKKMSEAQKGKRLSSATRKKISEAETGKNHPRYDPTIYHFYDHKNNKLFRGTRYQFSAKYQYSLAAVNNLISGHVKTLDKKRWILHP